MASGSMFIHILKNHLSTKGKKSRGFLLRKKAADINIFWKRQKASHEIEKIW